MGRGVQLGLVSVMGKGWGGSGAGGGCVQLLGSTGTVREGNGFWGLVMGCASAARKRVGGQTGGRGVCGSREFGALQELVLALGLEQGGFFSPWSIVQVLATSLSSYLGGMWAGDLLRPGMEEASRAGVAR